MNRLMQIVIIICFCLGMMTLDCFAESEIPIYPAWEITLSPARTGGTGGSLYVSNNNTEIATEEAYKTYLSYSLNGIDKSRVTSALIEAVCTQGAVGEKEKLQIYGVPEPIDMISPDTITWENAPCNIPSSAVALSEEALFLADLCTDKKKVPLTAVSQRLTEFVQEDTNGVITLIVVRQSLRNSRYSLASSENKNYPPPVLRLSGGLAIEGFDEVWKMIEDLPETDLKTKVKKASLLWALEDARDAVLDGLIEQAEIQVSEVKQMAAMDIGQDSGKRIFPDMLVQKDNSYLSGLESKADEYIKKPAVYHKSWDWGLERFPEAKNLRSEFADRLETESFLFCQPVGFYSGNTELLTDIFSCLEALTYYHKNGDLNAGRTVGDANMNRFVYSAYNIALLQVLTAYPDILPLSVRDRWLNTVHQTAEYQIETFGTINILQPHGAGYYANMDCCYTAMMEAAGKLLDFDQYCQSASARSERIESYMCLDGAWPYMGYANESPTYHQTDIHYLTYYYLMSQNPQTLSMLQKSAPYYPLTLEKNNLIEYSTTLYFKQYWDKVDPGYIEVIASLAQNGQNRWLAQQILEQSGTDGSIFGALFYDPAVVPEKIPQNRVVYDRNIMGPRSHFEHFSYYINGRDLKDDRGKPTLAGAVAIGDGDYPSEGFLENAYGGVYNQADHAWHLIQENKSPSPFDMGDRTAPVNDYAMFEAQKVSAFGSVYYLQVPRAGGARCSVTDFGGMQTWLLLPDRVIGLVETRSLETQTAFGMEGVLQFGEGRGKTAQGWRVQNLQNNTYQYGQLQITIHDQNYGSVLLQSPKYSELNFYGPVDFIVFRDTDLTQNQIYEKGDKRYYLAEIGLYGNEPAQVQREYTDGIDYLKITIDNTEWYIWHNTLEVQQTVMVPAEMICTQNIQSFYTEQGQRVTIPAYGILLGQQQQEKLMFRYETESATELKPGQELILENTQHLSGTLYLAVFADGCVHEIKTSTEKTVSVCLPENATDLYVKGFLLDEKLRPVCESATLMAESLQQ